MFGYFWFYNGPYATGTILVALAVNLKSGMYIVTDIDIAKGHPKVSVQIILLFLSKWKKKQAFATIHKLEIRHAKTKC